MKKSLNCRCGNDQFHVHLDAHQQVGLVTCAEGHHSLLLDSRDHWLDVLQDKRPRLSKCSCGNKSFQVALVYRFLPDTETVRDVELRFTCTECRLSRSISRFEFDYEPTAKLLEEPLDPYDNPWLKPKRVSKTALWTVQDLEAVLTHVLASGLGRIHVWRGREVPVACGLEQLATYLTDPPEVGFLLCLSETPLCENGRDAWKSHPFVQISRPLRMSYSTGIGQLYYLEYAKEVVSDGEILAQPSGFLSFAQDLDTWLSQRFLRERGRNTLDSPSEYQRLRGGW